MSTRFPFLLCSRLIIGLAALAAAAQGRAAESLPPIPIRFRLPEAAFVTLVIDDASGLRARNLVSETWFPAGENQVWWDGLDDLGRDPDAAAHAVFHLPGRPVAPGTYRVRGLTHPAIDLKYALTPYTHGDPPWNNGDPASQWFTNHSAPQDLVYLPAGVGPVRAGRPTSTGGQLLVCSRVAEGGSGLAWLDAEGKKLWGQHWLGGVWTAASHLAIDQGKTPVPGVYAYAAASWQGDKYNDYRSELRLHKLVDAAHRGTAPKDQRFGTGEDRPVLQPNLLVPLISPLPSGFEKMAEPERKRLVGERAANLTGLAVRNGIVWAAFADLNRVEVIDAHAGKPLGTIAVPGVRGLEFDPAGRLLALAGGRLLRYAASGETGLSLPAPEILATNLEDPQDLAIDATGNIFVSDWGSSHQIKRFDPSGRPLTPLGEPGAPATGAYNPRHLNRPAGMAVDDRGRLWVAENSHIPKRVSVWDGKTGALVDAFYGPMRYGGAGAVDPQDPTRFFYDDDHGGTIEFKLDYATGKSAPVAIPYLAANDQTGIEGRNTGGAPSYPLHHRGRTYLTNAFSLPTSGRRSATLWRLDPDGVARIVSAAGNIIDSLDAVMPAFLRPEIQARMPAGFVPAAGKALFFVWSDVNGNQRIDPPEIQFALPTKAGPSASSRRLVGSVVIDDDLAWTVATLGEVALQLQPVSVDGNGVPRFDLAQSIVLARGVQNPASSGGGQVLAARDGWTITTTPVAPLPREAVGGVRHGEPRWTYPSLWPGLHAGHIAPVPTEPGQLIATTRVIGNVIDAPPGSDAGQLWAINADKGTIYVFTVDGLFVTRLFQDSRTASWNAPKAIRGMSVRDYSLNQECFGPVWTRTKAGEIYLQAGAVGNILRVENLDRVRRLPDQEITVTRAQLAAAQQWNLQQEADRQAARAHSRLPLETSPRATAPVVDGISSDWAGSQWVEIDTRTRKVGNWKLVKVTTRASATIAAGRLYLIWQTDDPDLLRNSGESPNNLFKTGGALDVMIGTDATADPARRSPVPGDQRLLVSRVQGRPIAVLYAPVAPGTTTAPVVFGSPLRTIRFDRVEVVSDRIELASRSEPDLSKDPGGSIRTATYELSIPLETLGFRPAPGESFKFDVGLLRGDGAQTLQRAYWTNQATGLVSDIPSEAELTPALWGVLKIAPR